MYALAVLDVVAGGYVDEIPEFDAQVVTRDLVYLNFALIDVIRAEDNEDGVSPFLSPA